MSATCPLCHGRGGTRVYANRPDTVANTQHTTRWIRCARCKPTRAKKDAIDDALERFRVVIRNPHARQNAVDAAYNHCLKLGVSAAELHHLAGQTQPERFTNAL